MKFMNLLIIALALAASSCGSDEPASSDNSGNGNSGNGGGSTEVTETNKVTSYSLIDINTDKAVYNPGETVTFRADNIPSGASIRYRQGADVIKEEKASASTWTWTTPADDFKGYMVDIYSLNGNTETIYGSIAVDVSSDWKRFPRYGFVATFDNSKLAEGVIESEMEFLNRCHINGVQFQDWHYKHHWPLGGDEKGLYDTYTDIANREVCTAAVKKYIDVQHALGMKSIFYNLCFGVLDDAAADGVKEEWYLFKNADHGDKDCHSLPSSWKSNIFLVDPSNVEWQEYIGKRNDDVYANLDFDGYQIDQLGDRGILYDYKGNKVNLPKGYGSFLDAMKQRHPDKRLVMNAVSSYGASIIAGSGKVDFCYNEAWGDEDKFQDLYTIIKANEQYSQNQLATVFAAYMNYDLADRSTGYMNTPGVIMADAVIMALGGSHLELGDHMLSREYFPASPLAMTEELKEAMIRYYDFMTAYQNLLRDPKMSNEYTPSVACENLSANVKFNNWPPQQGSVTAFGKKASGKEVIHLLNFLNIDNLSWRDLNGTRKVPTVKTNMPLKIASSKSVSKVWMASPDYHGGVPQELAFKQTGGYVTFTLPALKYWTMIVME